MDEKHIVAIDLGTSKFALTIARIEGEDIQIVYYREVPASGIKYSYISNPSQVGSTLRSEIGTAEKELNIKVTQAVVGLPRYSVRQETKQGFTELDPDEYISAERINYLKDMAQLSYPLENPTDVLFGIVAQSFSTSEDFQLTEQDIIGMASDKLEGNFKVFIGNKRYQHNIDMVFNEIGVAIASKYFTPDTTAKAVLTTAEMESGVALIDFGAGVTSVCVYSGGIMRHYASIPFGGKSITSDINKECKTFSESLAENIKLAHGICMPEKLQNMNEKILRINIGTTAQYKDLPVKYLSEVITCRVQEIMEAILYEIQKSGFADRLQSGIVLTGGGANLANCRNFITELSGYTVRIGYPRPLFSSGGCIGVHEAEAATAIGMLLAAVKDNCGDCVVLDTEAANKTSVIVEQAVTEDKDTADSEKQEKQTYPESLFPDEEPAKNTGTAKTVKKDDTRKKDGKKPTFSWVGDKFNGLRKNIQKTVDNFTGTLYDKMNDEGV